MRKSELYIVADQTDASALPLINDAISSLASACRADPWQLEPLEAGVRTIRLIGFGADSSSSVELKPLSGSPLPLVSPSSGVGLLSLGLSRVFEERMASGCRCPDLLIFAKARSFDGMGAWLSSLAQFDWGWTSIYLLDDGAESEAEALSASLYAKDGNGRVIGCDEFLRLSGKLASTIDFGWAIEAPISEPFVPPKGAIWVARGGAEVAKGVTPECFGFLRAQGIFRPTDHYWTEGMSQWALVSAHP